jgi:hypothetical protein
MHPNLAGLVFGRRLYMVIDFYFARPVGSDGADHHTFNNGWLLIQLFPGSFLTFRFSAI